jgi:hypothetical protein
MDEQFKVKHLLADELTYELRIRGITTSRNQDDKRKLLARALSKELGRPDEYFLSLHDAEYDHDTEVQAIEDTLESIRTILTEFEGTAEDMIFKRLKTRLTHLSFRIRRMRRERDAEYRNEAYATCLLLEADLHDKAAEASPVTVEAPPVVATTPIYVHPHARSPEPKLVPIHTWGVSFNGEENGMTVNQFLERVEELSVARNATNRDLFNAAIDLFSGKALIWYRSVRSRLSDWDEVVQLLKQEFLPPDFDELLWDEIKDALVSAPVLSSPDFSKPFVIQTDASNTGLGAVLTQDLDGDERVIAYASRSLTKAERNYSVTERECLAVLFALEKFRPYVEGTHFTIVTDHYSLLWLNRMKDPAGKLARWSVKLNQFSFDLVHRKGKLNVVPDALSRLPAEIAAVDIDSFLGVNLNDLDESYTRLRDNIIANPQRNPSWKVENGLVYRFVPNKIVLPGNVPEWKLLVPRNQRTKILESCHDAPTSAHFGYYKTLSRLSINHFWPKMRRSVIRYVRNCKVCNEQKAPNTARAGLMGKEKKVQFPWQMISVDLIGPLPTSTKGYSYLLVIVDWFTKYVVLFPLRKATSSKVTECIENGIFLVYGVPQFILVDNGKQFVGNEFVKTCENYKVQKIWFTAKYHPQSNPVERYNRTVGTAIRSYVKGAHKKWDAEVAKIGYAIRTAVNEVTGFSPAFLNFGRVVPCTGEFYGKVAENPETLTTADREDHAKNLEHLKTILQDVTQHLHKAHERNERSYNLRKRDAEFFVGDKVWKRNKVLSSAAKDFAQKLAPRYVLCTITRKLSKLAYALEDENRADLGVWHMKDLKEFRGSLAEAEEP